MINILFFSAVVPLKSPRSSRPVSWAGADSQFVVAKGGFL
jgi:hypothetical protein